MPEENNPFGGPPPQETPSPSVETNIYGQPIFSESGQPLNPTAPETPENQDNPFGKTAPKPTLSEIRNSQFQQLRDNPALVGDLFSLVHQEVGSQGPEAQQAFIETVFNRAAARGQTLDKAMHDKGYYPKISFTPAELSDEHVTNYGNLLGAVGMGSNISNGATGNASGKVKFAGGPQTFSAGGERFGVEGPDVGRTPAPTTGIDDNPFGKPPPEPLPTPSIAQRNESALQNFVTGLTGPEGLLQFIPTSAEQVGQMFTGSFMPFLQMPEAIGSAYDSIQRLVNTGELPQMGGPLKKLEDIKIEYGGDSPEYQIAAGKVAGTMLPQMAMAALGIKSLTPKPVPPVPSMPPIVTESGVRGSGKFRATYNIDKTLGDMMEGIGASKESGGLRGEIAVRNLTHGLNPSQVAELGQYLVSKRLESIRLQNQLLGAENPQAAGIMIGGEAPHPQELPPSEMQRIASDPKIARALDYYRKEIKPDIESWRLRAGLSETAAAGKDPEFISLIKKEEPIPRQYGKVQQASRLARKTRFAKQATGKAPEYTTNISDIIKESYSDVIRKARVNDFYKEAQAKGLAEPVTISTPEGPRSVVNFDSLPTELQQQLRAATEVPLKPTGVYKGIRSLQRGSTGLALTANPAELMNHMRRQLNVVAGKPPIGMGLIARLEWLLPYIGPKVGAFVRTVAQDAGSPQFKAILQDIFDAGGGSSRSFSNMYELRSPIAKWTGLKWLQRKTHNLLFGIPKGRGVTGWDLRMRVQLEQIRRAAEHNVDPQRIREFANQIGQYGSHPDWLIAAVREINPYAATTLPMRWTEMKQAVGLSGMKESFMRRRFHQAETLLRGTGGTILGLTAANYLLSGKYPWENDAGHEFDLNTGLKTDDGKTLYVKFRVIAPELSRPIGTVGLPGISRERTADHPQYLAAFAASLINQGLSIVGGPAQNALLTATTGKVPYFVKSPGRAAELMDVAQPAKGKEEGFNRGLEQITQAAQGLNPLAEGLIPTNAKRIDVEAPGLLKYLERPVAGFHGIKPFGDVFTQSYEKKAPKRPPTGAQRAAMIRRKLRKQAMQSKGG